MSFDTEIFSREPFSRAHCVISGVSVIVVRLLTPLVYRE